MHPGLVPLSAIPKMLNCSCFTVAVDTMDEAATLAVRDHLTAQHWNYPNNFSSG